MVSLPPTVLRSAHRAPLTGHRKRQKRQPFFGMDGARASRHALVMAPKPTHSPPNATRIVEVLAFPAVQLLDVTGPLQVFASANDQAAWAGDTRPYEIRLVAPGGQSVEASAGVALAAGPL